MRARSRGPKYRNLHARTGGVIYYERVWNGRRYCFSTKTTDWKEAAAVRDLYEQRKGIGLGRVRILEAPTFEEFAERYLAEDVGHLADTSRRLRERELRAGSRGGLLEYLGSKRLDEITKRDIREWWGRYVERRGRSTKTGRNYLDALSGVLNYARALELIPDDHDPVDAFRRTLRLKSRTKRGRAESQAGREVRPLERPEEVHALVQSARQEGPAACAFVLAMLDAGLRLGEARALRWSRVVWGDEDDPRRHLLIDRNLPTSGDEGLPKSGRERRVALSRRLREALFDLYRGRSGSPREDRIFPELATDPGLQQWRKTVWRAIEQRADLGKVNPKDLRDTFASQLLTAGVQLGYVSAQLGHADVSVTAKHYAKWCGAEGYRDPMTRQPGEVPADFLARLESQQSPKTSPDSTSREKSGNPSNSPESLGAQDWNRTSTPLRELGPEPSASTNSATWAGGAIPFCLHGLRAQLQRGVPTR